MSTIIQYANGVVIAGAGRDESFHPLPSFNAPLLSGEVIMAQVDASPRPEQPMTLPEALSSVTEPEAQPDNEEAPEEPTEPVEILDGGSAEPTEPPTPPSEEAPVVDESGKL